MILITCISLRTTDKTCYPLYIGFCGTPLGPATTILVVLSLVRLFSDPMDRNLPGSSVHGIFQTRIPELVAISYSRKSSQPQGLNLRLLFLLYWQANSLPLVPPGIKFPGIHGLSLSFLFCCINLFFFFLHKYHDILLLHSVVFPRVWYGKSLLFPFDYFCFNILNI